MKITDYQPKLASFVGEGIPRLPIGIQHFHLWLWQFCMYSGYFRVKWLWVSVFIIFLRSLLQIFRNEHIWFLHCTRNNKLYWRILLKQRKTTSFGNNMFYLACWRELSVFSLLNWNPIWMLIHTDACPSRLPPIIPMLTQCVFSE